MQILSTIYDLKAEEAVIGSIIIGGNKLFEESLGIVNAQDFYKTDLTKCFKIFVELYKKKIPIDLVSLTNYIAKNKIDVPLEILFKAQNSVPTILNLPYYLKVVKEYSYKRQFLVELEKFKMDKITIEELAKRIYAIPKYEEVKEKSNRDIILETVDDARKGMDYRFPENFRKINRILGGFDRGDLIVIGGYPSNGKSSLMTALTVGLANEGHRILILTLEMSPKANMRRILANMNQINTMKFRENTLTDLDKERIKAVIPIVNDTWHYNCARAYNMPDIIRMINRYEPDILFIDYLQNITDPDTKLSPYLKATKHTLEIQQFTKEKNIATFLLSQFHRPVEGKIHRPYNRDLRDSGAIEERADVIFLLYWERKLKMESLYRMDGDNPEYIELNITKSKDGATGGLHYNFYPEYHRWLNPDDDEKEPIIYKKAKEVSGEYYKPYKDDESEEEDELPF